MDGTVQYHTRTIPYQINLWSSWNRTRRGHFHRHFVFIVLISSLLGFDYHVYLFYRFDGQGFRGHHTKPHMYVCMYVCRYVYIWSG